VSQLFLYGVTILVFALSPQLIMFSLSRSKGEQGWHDRILGTRVRIRPEDGSGNEQPLDE